MTSRRAVETERRLRRQDRQTFPGNPSGLSAVARPLDGRGGTFVGAGAPASAASDGGSSTTSGGTSVADQLIVSDQDSNPPVLVWSDDGSDFIYGDA